MDLDEPADVYWTEEMSPNVVRCAAEEKLCETIAEAVRFVHGNPACAAPGGADIGADKDLDLEEIRAIYESPEYAAFKG